MVERKRVPKSTCPPLSTLRGVFNGSQLSASQNFQLICLFFCCCCCCWAFCSAAAVASSVSGISTAFFMSSGSADLARLAAIFINLERTHSNSKSNTQKGCETLLCTTQTTRHTLRGKMLAIE
uniref:(northern house mosquito) hypothetical protein n=1 Tax=Culex pipiens TaxID=7175 RepID=A0A8D8BAV4_CULPI